MRWRSRVEEDGDEEMGKNVGAVGWVENYIFRGGTKVKESG